MFTRRLVTGLISVCALLVAACGANKPSGKPSDGAMAGSSATASVGPSATAEREALIAYRGMWNAFVEAGKVSDPDAPDLRKYASDQALRLIVSSLYTDRDQGRVTKGDLALNPKVTEVKPVQAPTEATVVDCVDSTRWLKYKASGELWDDNPGGKHFNTAVVTLADGTWKVSSFILKESGTC